jgi:hypothetical protein
LPAKSRGVGPDACICGLKKSTLLAHTAAKESLHSCSGHFVALKERWGG